MCSFARRLLLLNWCRHDTTRHDPTRQVVALSTSVPFHPLNAWTRQVKGPLNGFTHGGYQVRNFTVVVACMHRTRPKTLHI